MPRNLTTGLYSPPAGTYGVSGSPISSTAYNLFVNDIGNEITNSVDPRGETPMQAALNMGSQKIVGLATGVASTDAANVGQLLSLTAPGSIMLWAGSSSLIPTGWLWCNGQAVSRATYANLFSAIGTAFGVGDGSTTFNLPSLIDRVPTGAGNVFGFASIGGELSHTLTYGEMPSHNHAISDPTHTHSQVPHSHGVNDPGHFHGLPFNLVKSGSSITATGGTLDLASATTNGAVTGISIQAATASNLASSTGISIQNAGGGGAHNNLQPYLALNYIIKT